MKKKEIATGKAIIILMMVALIGFSCEDRNKRFKMVPSSHSNIEFANHIVESEERNILNYLYMYNGGGVAIGDINNDQLPDIFFTANQQANKLYLNKGSMEFEDITHAAGMDGNVQSDGWTTGVTMVDINNDDWLDIYVCKVNGLLGFKGSNQLFVNNGDGTFTEKAKEYGLNIKTYAQQAAFFDYDADGDLDMYLLNQAVHTPNSYKEGELRIKRDSLAGDRLYKNEDGYFHDVSSSSGIYGGAMGYGLALAIGDVDNNGFPDIYVSNDFHENDYLYYNQGDGTFVEGIKESFGHISTFSMGNDLGDVNNDGWLDLITLDMRPDNERLLKKQASTEEYDVYQYKLNRSYYHQFSRNMLQINKGNLFGEKVSFIEIGEFSGVSSTDWSWGALFADFDLDGKKDLFITNGIPRRPNNLDFINYKSDQIDKESENYAETINAIPTGEASNYMFKNIGDKFKDVSRQWGLDLKGFSNGMAYGDLDNDGDLDLVVNNLNDKASVYENKSLKLDGPNGYLKIKLKGSTTNTKGIGTRVTVSTMHTKQIQECFPVKGWLSTMEGNLVFGMGKETTCTVTVRWSDGLEQVLENVEVNTTLTLEYDKAVKHLKRQRDHEERKRVFQDVSHKSGITYEHKENGYVDFKYERLIPKMISREGPKLAVGDLNGDGLDDFYVGGAKDQEGELYLQQQGDVLFRKKEIPDFVKDRGNEDVGAVFFDVDGDMDLDLYVVGGSGESFQDFTSSDRLYVNDGKANFTKSLTHPNHNFNGSCIVKADFNEDGIDDLFLGARSIPGAYGKYKRSRILFGNGNGALYDVTEKVFGGQIRLGMVTDATWMAKTRELAVVGEWMPLTILDFKNMPLIEKKIPNTEGWWNTISVVDLDDDGDEDLLLGNMGENSNIKTSLEYPVNLYLKDFDGNSSLDPILSHYENGIEYPYYGLDKMASQLVALKKLYTTYESYSESDFSEVFPKEELQGAARLQAFTFKSTYFERDGAGNFIEQDLPLEMQFSPLYSFAYDDFDYDGDIEVLAGGNYSAYQLNIGKCDASYGHFIKKDKTGALQAIEPRNSGFALDGEVRDIKLLKGPKGKKWVLVSKNNKAIQIFSY